MVDFRLFFCSLFTLCLISVSDAQVPGYLGKRLVLQVDGLSSPTLSNPSVNNRAWRDSGRFRGGNGRVGVNVRMGVQANFAVARNATLFMKYDRQRTAMKTEATSLTVSRFEQKFYELRGQAFTFGFKAFSRKKGALAPFGVYRGLHLTYMHMNGILQESWHNDVPTNSLVESFGVVPEKGYLFGGMEFGVNQIFWDQVVINLSGQINLPLNIRRIFDWDSSFNSFINPLTDAERNQERFDQAVFRRLAGQSIFLMQVGVGYLLF
jgi:hypothetical protein